MTQVVDIKQSIINYVDQRLTIWADWFKGKTQLGVGFPTCAIEYRLMIHGILIRENLGKIPLPSNDAAEEIEDLIKDMAIQYPEIAEVLRYYYLTTGNAEQKIRGYGMSSGQFFSLLSTARWWLVARLTDKKQIKELMILFKKLSAKN